MKVTISSKGEIAIPAAWREQDQIRPGQQFLVERLDAGEYLLKKLAVPEKPGLIDWLLECPAKGWYRPLPMESTDTLSTKRVASSL